MPLTPPPPSHSQDPAEDEDWRSSFETAAPEGYVKFHLKSHPSRLSLSQVNQQAFFQLQEAGMASDFLVFSPMEDGSELRDSLLYFSTFSGKWYGSEGGVVLNSVDIFAVRDNSIIYDILSRHYPEQFESAVCDESNLKLEEF